jgi:O-antigen ligase
MDFFLLLIVTGTLFVRPAELIPAIEAWPIYEVAILSCAAVAFPRVLGQLSIESLRSRPITACVVGLLFAVVMSHLSHFFIWGARMSGFAFFKLLLYYLLLVGILNTPGRLIKFLYALVAFTIVLTGLALLQYHHVVEIPALAQLEQREFDPVTGEHVLIARLRSTGIYNDPNDLSMILVVSMLISLYGLMNGRDGLLRTLFLASLGLFGYALALTHSRGGLLALLAGLFVLLWLKYGWRRAVLLAAPAVAALPLLVSDRQADFAGAVEDGSGQSRIQLWSEGLRLFQQAPLFGIGQGYYAEEAGQVAHNSFIHTFAELGFFGGALFLGTFVVAVEASLRSMRQAELIEDRGLQRFAPYLLALLAAYAVGMLSLSRPYVPPTYLILALATSFFACCGFASSPALPRFDGRLVQRLAVQSVCFLAATYIFVRVFVRWS